MKKQLSAREALIRLQDLCARSEQCSPDLRKKLSGWTITSADADRIMESLVKHRFVDDARFARAYTADKLRFSGWGRYKIMRGLMTKRLGREIIETALATIDMEEYTSVARRVLIVKARAIKEGNTYEGRTKLFRFGASRGFETELIARLIRTEDLWHPHSSED